MQFTVIGLIVGVVGLALLRASATAMLCFVLACSLMGGSAAIVLPALGYASIQPAYFALGFLVLRLAILGLSTRVHVLWSVRTNAFLALFVIYGFIGAFAFPRLFEGQIEVAPMRMSGLNLGILDGQPLRPTPQNITQAVYSVGTLLAALCTAMAAHHDNREKPIINALIAVSWVHIAFGLLDLLLYNAGASDLLRFFRNATYEQLSQDVGQFHRISGIFPEPSAYAGYAFALLALNTELWLRNIRPRLTGATAVALVVIILASTSSAGLVALGLYAPILGVRMLFARPAAIATVKVLVLATVTATALIGVLAVMIWRQDFAAAVSGTLQDLIVNKPTSESGVQRAYWARQGVTAFLATNGLGVGPGSFRSSSLFTAILGATGLFGTLCFLLHAWRFWNPLQARAHALKGPPRDAFGAAAGWAAVLGLIPMAVASPGADPGYLFAIFGGLALAWGRPDRAVRAAVRPVRGREGLAANAVRPDAAPGEPAGSAALRVRDRRYPNRSARR